jgi:hypothetical protein
VKHKLEMKEADIHLSFQWGTALLQKHCDLPNTQMWPSEPSYSVCRKDFEKFTFNLQIDEWNILDLYWTYSI